MVYIGGSPSVDIIMDNTDRNLINYKGLLETAITFPTIIEGKGTVRTLDMITHKQENQVEMLGRYM